MLLKNWESRINTVEHLKAWQSFYKLVSSLTKKQKGRFGEDLALHVLESELKLTLVHKNMRTPYGEIDLIMKGQGFVLFVEVKLDLLGREGDEVWSKAQRLRFSRSQAWYAKQNFIKVKAAVVLIKKDKIFVIFI